MNQESKLGYSSLKSNTTQSGRPKNDPALVRGRVALFFGILLIFISPFIFTRSFGWISFSTTGQIGSTIGGITAPITGLLGAYLVYLALMAQVKANQIIQQQIDEQKKEESIKQSITTLYEHYKILHEEIIGFEHITEINRKDPKDTKALPEIVVHTPYRGTMGILKRLLEYESQASFDDLHDETTSDLPAMVEIFQFLQFVIVYSQMIDDAKIPKTEKRIFSNLLTHLFLSKIAPPIEYFESTSKCSRCGTRHGSLPKELYLRTETARKKIYDLNEKYV